MVDVERVEIMRGHLDECLGHFSKDLSAKVPKGSRRATTAKKPMADFCGIGVQTVTRWLNDGSSVPLGEQRLKLMFFFDLVGYRVLEIENMKPTYRNFAGLIAFGLLTSDDAAKELGYSSQSSLFRILFGTAGTSSDKSRKMWDLWQARRAELEERKAAARKECNPDDAPTAASETDRSTPVLAASNNAATLKVMEALLALLERDRLCELPPKGLAALRREGGEVILRLAAKVNGLSSKLLASGHKKGGG